MTLTNWYPSHIKPARIGVYQILMGGSIVYSRWNGEKWEQVSRHLSLASQPSSYSMSQEKIWRGVENEKD